MFGGLKIWAALAIVGAIVGALAGVKFHFDNDASRKVELAETLAANVVLEEANKKAFSSNELLTERIKTHNAEKLAAVAQAQIEMDKARESVAAVKVERAIIKEQMDVLNFTILEAIRDDEDYEDWSYGDVHVTVWEQLRNADEGENSFQPE